MARFPVAPLHGDLLNSFDIAFVFRCIIAYASSNAPKLTLGPENWNLYVLIYITYNHNLC